MVWFSNQRIKVGTVSHFDLDWVFACYSGVVFIGFCFGPGFVLSLWSVRGLVFVVGVRFALDLRFRLDSTGCIPGTVPYLRVVTILIGVFIYEAFGQGHEYNF